MKITSFEHGCEVCGYNPDVLPEVSHLPAVYHRADVAAFKLFVISQASWKCDGKTLDWNDSNQQRWLPRFDMKVDKNNPTGFRFRGSLIVGDYTAAGGGCRICYPSQEDSDYHGLVHLALYRDMMVYQDTDQQSLNPVSASPRADGQEAVIRQLVKSNLQLQAQTRMLRAIVATCITGPRQFSPGEMSYYLQGELIDELMERKLNKMLEISLDQVLGCSPLAVSLSDEDRQDVKNF